MNYSWQIFKALCVGDGVGRILMDNRIDLSVELEGIVLDVGGQGKHTYRELLDEANVTRFLVVDIMRDPTVDINCSITHLPFVSERCDTILCFNVLEHVFEYEIALEELRRILKPGGNLYGRVPFLMNVHADPFDYWRYTSETLRKLLDEAGFTQISIETDGGLFLVFLNLLNPVWRRIGPLRVLAIPFFLLFNKLGSIIIGERVNRERYPLGYFFSAE